MMKIKQSMRDSTARLRERKRKSKKRNEMISIFLVYLLLHTISKGQPKLRNINEIIGLYSSDAYRCIHMIIVHNTIFSPIVYFSTLILSLLLCPFIFHSTSFSAAALVYDNCCNNRQNNSSNGSTQYYNQKYIFVLGSLCSTNLPNCDLSISHSCD